MIGLVELASGLLDRRQLSTTWLPLLGFLTALGAILVSALGWAVTLFWWDGLSGEGQAAVTIAVLLLTMLTAQIVSARRMSIIKLTRDTGPASNGLVRRSASTT